MHTSNENLAEDTNTHKNTRSLGPSPGQNPHLCEVKPKRNLLEREDTFYRRNFMLEKY